MDANKPKLPIAAPVRLRHALDAINRRSRIRHANGVALPNVDMVRDTDLIRRGNGEFLGSDRWRVNGRTYVREKTPAGTLYPESGPGIVVLDRAEYRALVILATYNGYTEQAANELSRNPHIADEAIEVARNLYAQRTRKS